VYVNSNSTAAAAAASQRLCTRTTSVDDSSSCTLELSDDDVTMTYCFYVNVTSHFLAATAMSDVICSPLADIGQCDLR